MFNNKIKVLTYFLLVIIFEVLFIMGIGKVGVIFKIAPSIILLLFILKLKGFNRVYMLLALIFCVAGDAFLHIDRDNLFMGGLIAFALAHIVYLIYFLKYYKKGKSLLIPTIIILVYGVVLGWQLWGIGDLQYPVYFYLAVIIFMAAAGYKSKLHNWFLFSGVTIFVFSDTVLAINKFLVEIPYATPINIFLYFVSQLLIVYGVLRSRLEA